MSNYSATVVRISNLRPHTNADRLVCTDIFGNNVIVGKDTQVGELGLFFPLESQIGAEFAEINDLIRRKDENGKPAGGMFDQNRRVRAQTFRGEKSMGFWIPIESLHKLFPHLEGLTYPEGTEIEELEGFKIATKYIPRNSRTPGSGGKKEGRKPRESRIIPDQFRFHFDTAQLGKNLNRISPDDQIVITWKMHGTSAIVSNCLTKRKLSWLEKLLSKVVKIETSVYDYIYASRRVVKNEFIESKNHFYGHDLWSEIGKENFEGMLHKGETVYYEIVGFTKDGSPIQKGFDYGCSSTGSGQYKIFVYRITMTSPDGSVTELQWNQVKARCIELGVKTVPEIFYGNADTMFNSKGWVIDMALIPPGETPESLFEKLKNNDPTIPHNLAQGFGGALESWQESFFSYLQMRYVYDQDSQFCINKVPEEGICVRKEGLNIEVYKLKSFRFLQHETKQLDSGETSMEEEN